MTPHGTPAGSERRQTQCPRVQSLAESSWIWPISCQSAATSQHPQSRPPPTPPLPPLSWGFTFSPLLPLARRGPAASGETPSQMKSRRAGGVTAVQTLCTVVAPNLSGYGCRIYYGVIRTKTALRTVPGGRRVTTGQQAPSGPAPGLEPHRFTPIQCEFQILWELKLHWRV